MNSDLLTIIVFLVMMCGLALFCVAVWFIEEKLGKYSDLYWKCYYKAFPEYKELENKANEMQKISDGAYNLAREVEEALDNALAREKYVLSTDHSEWQFQCDCLRIERKELHDDYVGKKTIAKKAWQEQADFYESHKMGWFFGIHWVKK